MNEKIVFLHLPKTGGTTLHNLLIKHFEEDEICKERTNELAKVSEEEIGSKRLFSGHFTYNTVIQKIPEPRKIITLLREPKSRILSEYYFRRSHKIEFILEHYPSYLPAKKYNLSDYLDHQKNEIGNKMTRFLSDSELDEKQQLDLAKKRLREMTAIGITEEIGFSINFIFSSLGFPIPTETPRYLAFDKLAEEYSYCEKIVKEPLTNEIKQKLDELTYLDQQLYKYAVQLWSSLVLS